MPSSEPVVLKASPLIWIVEICRLLLPWIEKVSVLMTVLPTATFPKSTVAGVTSNDDVSAAGVLEGVLDD